MHIWVLRRIYSNIIASVWTIYLVQEKQYSHGGFCFQGSWLRTVLCVWILGRFLLFLSVNAGRRLAQGQLAQQGPLGQSKVSPAALARELFIQLMLKAWAAEMLWRQVFEHHYNFSSRPVIMLLAWYNHPAACKMSCI